MSEELLTATEGKINGPSLDIDDRGHGVVVHKNKKYATNLIWLTVGDLDDQNVVVKKAKLLNVDFYCNRLFVQQVGFGKLSFGHRMGMPSIAAMAADALIGEWHGVFEVDSGWLYVAVHADNIAPKGDIFFSDEEEAYHHLIDQLKNYKWPKTYVPNTWEVENSDGEIDIDRILDDVSSTSLKPVNLDALFGGKSNKSFVFLICTCLLVFIVLFSIAPTIVKKAVPSPISAPEEEFVISDALIVPPKEPQMIEDPLNKLIERTRLSHPRSYLDTCVENFDSIMVSFPGWRLLNMRCRGNFVEGSWRNENGSLETLRSNIDQLPLGVSKTYGSNSIFLASKVITSFRKDVALTLLKRESAIILLNENLDGLGNMTLIDRPAVKRQNLNFQKNKQQNKTNMSISLADLPAFEGRVSTPLSPLEIKDNFNIPGLQFNVIEWNFNNGEWIYDFIVYLEPENYNE